MSADSAPYDIVRKLEVDTGALHADALARGITATLYLLPYLDEARSVVLINHQAQTILAEAMSTDVCRTLFGVDEIGEYDIVTTRKLRAQEGSPVH